MRIDREKFTVALLKRELTQKKFSEMTGLSKESESGSKTETAGIRAGMRLR